MKIAIGQINPRVGDLEANFKLIVQNIENARKDGAELIIFPELAILGYPPKDLLLKPGFIAQQNHFLSEIALYSDENFCIMLGAATENGGLGKPLMNSLMVFKDGAVCDIANKSLLPTYDVFDEIRYFEPSPFTTVFEYKGIKIGLSICEDIWMEAYPSLYLKDPIAELLSQGAELIINAAASPFSIGKAERRKKLIANLVRRYQVPIIYVNQTGANDQLIFDGGSLAFDSQANLVMELAEFEESCQILDSEDLKLNPETKSFEKQVSKFEDTSLAPSYEEMEQANLKQLRTALKLALKDYVHKCGFKKVILGLSGGIDSALVATLAVEALGKDNVYCIMMPSKFTSKASLEDAQKLASQLGLEAEHYQVIPITQLHDQMHESITEINALADENLQSRLRGNILMTLSNSLSALVLCCGNKSEIAVGYCTLYGDTCGSLALIGDLLKTMVFKLAKHINSESKREIIPENIINKAPSAELRENQKDEDSLPPYELLDKIILLYVQEMKSLPEIVAEGFDRDTVAKILNMIDHSEYKRQQMPLVAKVSGKAFGAGRRIPVAQGYHHKV